MQQTIFTILENRPLTDAVWHMTLRGDTGAITAPGQFVNIRLPGRYLRRPISICDWTESSLTLVYKVVGHGTNGCSANELSQKITVYPWPVMQVGKSAEFYLAHSLALFPEEYPLGVCF